jgi:hypothetical protein
MADPWWNVSAAVRGPGFSDENFHRVFHGLTREKTLEFDDERDLDDFTFAISYAFVVLRPSSQINDPKEHLEFISNRFGIKEMSFLLQGSPSDLMRLAVTKGGVSEAIMDAIRDEPNIKPARLYACSKGFAFRGS